MKRENKLRIINKYAGIRVLFLVIVLIYTITYFAYPLVFFLYNYFAITMLCADMAVSLAVGWPIIIIHICY